MLLYLIRHTDALELMPDTARPLSPRGRDEVRALVRLLGGTGEFQPAEIRHSTLLRARETAELLARGLQLSVPIREQAGLEPEADPHAIARQLEAERRSVALVGHEPHLSTLATILVAGRSDPPAFVMRKGAVIALARGPVEWLVQWHMAPQLFP